MTEITEDQKQAKQEDTLKNKQLSLLGPFGDLGENFFKCILEANFYLNFKLTFFVVNLS